MLPVLTPHVSQRLHGHLNTVWSLAFSPDGKILASASEDAMVRFWDVTFGQERGRRLELSASVNALAFAPKGPTLAVGDEEGQLSLHRFTDAGIVEQTSRDGHAGRHPGGRINALAFSPNGRRLAAGGGSFHQPGALTLWSGDGSASIPLIGHASEIMSLTFAPTSRFLASGDSDGNVYLWDLARGECNRTISAHVGAVWTCAYHGDERLLVTGGEDGWVRFWDTRTGTRLAELPSQTYGFLAFAFSHDGEHLAVGGFDGVVRLWTVGEGPVGRVVARHEGAVYTLAFALDDATLVTAGQDRTIACWEPFRRTSAPINRLLSHTSISCLASAHELN